MSNVRPTTPAPRFAIIVPVFQHSVLMTEAICTALREARLSQGVVVIVNDGCPYKETNDLCLTFAAADPMHVEYIRTLNGGLSAARNRGIRHALACYESVQAIYLLDADNRLNTGAMRRALATMGTTGADWVYPTIDKFGLEWSGDFSAPYSVLRHLFQNVCEAGSLIHRRVFDAGVFFDETMRQGYEDWEFWLQCIERNFRGAPCPELGFQYRARQESMIRDSDRDAAAILSYMHRKHRKLFDWKNILELEHKEVPRYCFIDTASQVCRFTSDPMNPSWNISFECVELQYWGSHAYPLHFYFPNQIIFLHNDTMAELARLRLMDWVLLQIEEMLETHSFVYVILDFQAESISFRHQYNGDPGTIFESIPYVIATSYKCLLDCALDPLTTWINTIRTENPQPKICRLILAGPFSARVLEMFGPNDIADIILTFLGNLRASRYKAIPVLEWRSQDALIPSRELFRNIRCQIKAESPVGHRSLQGQNEIAILLPMVSFGGVEQIAIQVAQQFRKSGWRTRLIVTIGTSINAPQRIVETFDSILFLNDPSLLTWKPSNKIYYGHNLQKWVTEGKVERLVGLIAGCAAVINCQAMHGNEVMGWLRRHGVVTISSLHLIDRDQFMAPVGHPYLMLAYEHAYDLIAAPSKHLLRFCSAAGVPAEKLLYLPNAPTFTVAASVRRGRLRMLQENAKHNTSRTLRVLSIGRLDRQKGLERLRSVIRRTQDKGFPVEWRLVGSRVIEGAGDSVFESVPVLPAVYDRASIIEHLLWADAVVMLSHWEGSPLLILEAQSLGTIPIVTNVGAVSEMIRDGVDGVLIPNGSMEEIVRRVSVEMRQLADNPLLRLHLGRNAIRRLRKLTWDETIVALICQTTTMVKKRLL